jgi:hypothetical protein
MPPLDLADYIDFIKAVTPNSTQEYMNQMRRFNMGAPGESDCPVFDGMYDYFAVSQPRCSAETAAKQHPVLAPNRQAWTSSSAQGCRMNAVLSTR